jgi:hypothetical protein
MFWGEQCLFPASTAPLQAARRLRILVTQHRVVEQRWRRYGGAQVRTSYHICRVQCAVCTASSTGYRSQNPLLFCALPAFPAEKILYRTYRTPYNAAASCFSNAPTAIQTFEHLQARDMASGYGDQSSSSPLFPLFGKLRFPQRQNSKSLTRPNLS